MTGCQIFTIRRFPKMVHWFSSSVLPKLLLKVILSSVFGQFADQRLTIAGAYFSFSNPETAVNSESPPQ